MIPSANPSPCVSACACKQAPVVTPTVLLILDGYGAVLAGPGNAASLANTPCLDALLALPGRTNIAASGLAVGLPEGYMGNSEVGHLNIGAGRVVYQDMTRIDVAMQTGELDENPAMLDLFGKIVARRGKLHLMGLLADGGVHSHINHLMALMRVAHKHGVPTVVHAFMDGRDTSPTSGAAFLEMLRPVLVETKAVLGTLVGRFYAMDRDKRWDRVKTAWDLLVHGTGQRASDPVGVVRAAYAEGKTDEFIAPHLLGDPREVCVQDGDGVVFFNFRADRARELAAAFHKPDFVGFERGVVPDLAGLVSMTMYDKTFSIPVAFGKDNLQKTLGEVVADAGLKQLRIAETEKYAHVTYFFSGGREEPFAGEERIMVDSPKDVTTYDQKPQMSAVEVTDKLVEALATGTYSLVVCNLANPDMVGHTGNIPAAVQALEVVDDCVRRILEAVDTIGGRMVLTADHGNVEEMLDAAGEPQTSHTCNPVPLLVVALGQSVPLASGGKLGDIATTILDLWNMPAPAEMTGARLALGQEKRA